MQNFGDIEAIKKIDPQNTFGSTDLMIKQCQTAWEQVKALALPSLSGQIDNVVFCGMGASIYGALVLKSLFHDQLSFPIEIISDYHLPSYVTKRTLVVLTSYSGTTEEVLSCAQEAKTKNASMLVLTQGGPLAEFAKTNNIPSYIFDGALNPAGVPRLGNGYTIIGLIGLFAKLGLITMSESDMFNTFVYMEGKMEYLKNKAIADSQQCVGKIPIIFAAEHLAGNAQILRNQFNETSKTFSSYYLVPDLNHHLMEGLQFPQNSNLFFVFLNSGNYSSKITSRMELTHNVVKMNKQQVFDYYPGGKTIYQDFLETLCYGSFLTLFLGLRYDQNPATNPWVDYFKAELQRAGGK